MILTAQIRRWCDTRASRAGAIYAALLMTAIANFSGCNPISGPEPEKPGAFLVSANELYWSELTAEGTDRRIGVVHTNSGAVLELTDIALAPDGALFAATRSQLWSVDRETAVATPVGSSLPDRTSALCFDAAGELYAASASNGALYRVDRVTGSVTPITYGSSYTSNGDLVFARNGALLATARRTGDDFDTLCAINPDSGVPVVVHSYLPKEMQGLCMVQGVIYGAAASDRGLYTINHLNGAYRWLRRLDFLPSGA